MTVEFYIIDPLSRCEIDRINETKSTLLDESSGQKRSNFLRLSCHRFNVPLNFTRILFIVLNFLAPQKFNCFLTQEMRYPRSICEFNLRVKRVVNAPTIDSQFCEKHRFFHSGYKTPIVGGVFFPLPKMTTLTKQVQNRRCLYMPSDKHFIFNERAVVAHTQKKSLEAS